MVWSAFPAECVTPVTPAEAERIARHYLYSAAERDRGDLLVVEEYEVCFTVLTRPKPVPPADPTAPPRPPANMGAAVSDIDKENGGVTFWPSLPMEVVADAYREAKLAGDVQLAAEWPQA